MRIKERFKHEFIVALRRARANNGCEVCFKVHDPKAPGCNGEECRARWERINASTKSKGHQS